MFRASPRSSSEIITSPSLPHPFPHPQRIHLNYIMNHLMQRTISLWSSRLVRFALSTYLVMFLCLSEFDLSAPPLITNIAELANPLSVNKQILIFFFITCLPNTFVAISWLHSLALRKHKIRPARDQESISTQPFRRTNIEKNQMNELFQNKK